MKALQRIAVLAIAILTLSLIGCVPSKQPLSDPAQSKPDENLFGHWLEKDGDDTIIWAIGRAQLMADQKNAPPGLMRAKPAEINKEGWVDRPWSLLFFVSKIRENSYLNLFEEKYFDGLVKDWNDAKIPAYGLIKYRVAGDRLELWLQCKRLDEVIEKGLVKGEINWGNKIVKFTTAGLTDTTENLARFMQNGGDRLLYGEKPDRVLTRLRSGK